jgi:hemerythrin superfamily protein
MNAIDMLKLDHRVVDALFQQAMEMQPSKRGPVYKKISNELAAHAHIEETVLYPRLLKEGNKDLKKIVLEGIEEHAQIHMFHDQLDTMKPAEEKFEPKLTVLQEDIRHHVKEEENEMFDLVESQFSSEALERLGEEMEAERTRFQKANGIPKRTAAENTLGQGMLTRMFDAVTGLFKPSSDDTPSRKTRSNGKKAASTSGRSNPGSTSGKTASRGNGSSKSVGSASASGTKSNGRSTTSNAKSSKSSKTGVGAVKSKSTSSKSASKGSSAK